mmetsp:Transcript_31727/g.91924  ORF Transcript_31727/g.91924 Transcript_31727/m.91924 type:complete len:306 (+) Transcript_31727:1142-2059(+)
MRWGKTHVRSRTRRIADCDPLGRSVAHVLMHPPTTHGIQLKPHTARTGLTSQRCCTQQPASQSVNPQQPTHHGHPKTSPQFVCTFAAKSDRPLPILYTARHPAVHPPLTSHEPDHEPFLDTNGGPTGVDAPVAALGSQVVSGSSALQRDHVAIADPAAILPDHALPPQPTCKATCCKAIGHPFFGRHTLVDNLEPLRRAHCIANSLHGSTGSDRHIHAARRPDGHHLPVCQLPVLVFLGNQTGSLRGAASISVRHHRAHGRLFGRLEGNVSLARLVRTRQQCHSMAAWRWHMEGEEGEVLIAARG